jgi:long-chain fatty acid transport protein
MRMTKIARALSLASLSLAAGAAGAAGFQLLEQNASGIGNAYAGSAAVAENASTIFFNPAGMTRLKEREVSAGLAAVRPSFEFSNKGSAFAPGLPASGGDGGDAGSWGFLPNAYLSWALNRDLYLGLGLGAPFGLVTEYDKSWVGRFQATKFDLKTININPSVAYRVNDKLSLGAGLNWQRLDAEYLRNVAAVSAVPALIPGLRATTVRFDADGDAWGWNAGVLFTLSANTRLGLSYRSSIEHEIEGDLDFAGPLANSALTGGLTSDVRAKAKVELPDTFILSVAQQLDERWEMLGDVSWSGWSSIREVNITRDSGALAGTTAQTLDSDFRDTWRVALGANYRYSDAWKLKFGVAWDQTPVRDPATRLVALPDNNRTWFATGAQWSPDKATRVDLGLAYLFVPESHIDNNQVAQGRGLVRGTYDASVWILGAQYSLAF